MKKVLAILGFALAVFLLNRLVIKSEDPNIDTKTSSSSQAQESASQQTTSNLDSVANTTIIDTSNKTSDKQPEENFETDSFIPFVPNALYSENNGPNKLRIEKGEDYKKLFPTDGLGHENEEGFGVVNEPVSDILAFLRTKVATRAGDAVLTQEKRNKSLFFKLLSGKSFSGKINFEDTSDFATFFLQISNGGNDKINVTADNKELESRLIPSSSEGIWRLDLLMDGMFLFQNRCPYNKAFDFEKKQLYYFVKSQTLGGIVYCNRRQEAEYIWHPLGFILAKKH